MVGPYLDAGDIAGLIAIAVFLALAVGSGIYRRWGRRWIRSLRRWGGRIARYWREEIQNELALIRRGEIVTRVRVIDGDTLDDCDTGVRYRLQNINAPETQDRAGCALERRQGELATLETIALVTAAKRVEVRPTGKIDRYGRTVAFVSLDGRDLGRLLVKRGLARPWTGKRESWCGDKGGLARMAKASSSEWTCLDCGKQSKQSETVIQLFAGGLASRR